MFQELELSLLVSKGIRWFLFFTTRCFHMSTLPIRDKTVHGMELKREF